VALKLGDNKLEDLPESIAALTSLTFLNVGYNNLKGLGDQFFELTALTHLDLSHNHLTTLSPKVGKLKAMKTMHLPCVGFSPSFSPPPSQPQRRLYWNLLIHFLSYECSFPLLSRNNKLEEVPTELGSLPLELLDLRYRFPCCCDYIRYIISTIV